MDCFIDLGSYKVCNATLLLFAYSNLFLLMLQALVSRILVPGMSNFLNASVRLSFDSFFSETVFDPLQPRFVLLSF